MRTGRRICETCYSWENIKGWGSASSGRSVPVLSHEVSSKAVEGLKRCSGGFLLKKKKRKKRAKREEALLTTLSVVRGRLWRVIPNKDLSPSETSVISQMMAEGTHGQLQKGKCLG